MNGMCGLWERNAYKGIEHVGKKPCRKKQLGRPRTRWERRIQMNSKEL
jgi:hypothetical protein